MPLKNPRLLILLAAAVMMFQFDWSWLQGLGALFLLLFAAELDETGPLWRRALWVISTAALLAAFHFLLDARWTGWLSVAGGGLLLALGLMLVIDMFRHQPGDGSVLTVQFFGAILFAIIGLLLVSHGLKT